jgi:broad specificity phosphatase PhoE
MALVYIIRHCQSKANLERRYNCTPAEDEGLSDEGVIEAEGVAGIFRGRPLGHVYTSPFPRARQTASRIGEASGAEVSEVDAFREMDCGEWNGRTEDEIISRFPEAWKGWHYDPQNNPIPGGESLLDVQARVLPEFERLVKKHWDAPFAIVTHYCVFNVLVCSLVSSLANFRCFDTGNGTVAEIAMENVPRLKLYSPPPRTRD